MAYRELSMIEVREVLRRFPGGAGPPATEGPRHRGRSCALDSCTAKMFNILTWSSHLQY